MNFIDYEPDETKFHPDFNIRFDMANTFKDKLRQPIFLKHWNEVPTFVRTRSNNAKKRVFLNELEKKITETHLGSDS